MVLAVYDKAAYSHDLHSSALAKVEAKNTLIAIKYFTIVLRPYNAVLSGKLLLAKISEARTKSQL